MIISPPGRVLLLGRKKRDLVSRVSCFLSGTWKGQKVGGKAREGIERGSVNAAKEEEGEGRQGRDSAFPNGLKILRYFKEGFVVQKLVST